MPITILDFTIPAKSSVDSKRSHSIETFSSSKSTLRPSRPPSLYLTEACDFVDVELLDPTLLPLESPSGLSIIPSSHNSLDSGFDPRQLVLPPEEWPQPPATIPILDRRSRRVLRMLKQEGHAGEFLAVGQAL